MTVSRQILRQISSSCPPPSIYYTRNAVVTLLDVSCALGKNLALLLKQNPYISELRLFGKTSDIHDVAQDLHVIDTRTRVVAVQDNLKEAITDANVVVSVGGCQTKLEETQTDLFAKNANTVRMEAIYMAEFNPMAVFCIARPPVEAMVPLVSEIYKKASVYDYRKLIGVTATASVVANHILASTNPRATSIKCPLVGGFSPQGTVAVGSQSKACVKANAKNPHGLQNAVGNAEEDVVALKNKYEYNGMMCLAPALAISRFINSVVRALQGVDNRVECAYIAQNGHIGQFLPYMTSIVKLGRYGIVSSHMPELNASETHRLKAAMPYILENIHTGLRYASGQLPRESKVDDNEQCNLLLNSTTKTKEFGSKDSKSKLGLNL